MVPMLAAEWPSRCHISRVKAATEVLPLVPVTAAMVAGWRGKNFAAASASARRGFVSRTNGTPRSSRGGCSPATATAPEAIAWSMNRAPSVFAPASAKKRSPGFTARLSAARPVTTMSPARASIATSSLNSSRSLMVIQISRRRKPLLRRLRCRKNKAVGRRQVEARLDSEERRDPRDHLAAGGNRVPAGGDEAVGFRQRLGLVQHHQQLELGIVGGQDRGEGIQHLLLGIAAADHLFRGARLAADVVALDVCLLGGADLGIEPHQIA